MPTYADCPSEILDEWSEIMLEEQGYICAYSMERISKGRGNMKREHIRPQNGKPENDLAHENLVAVCMGNEGFPPKDQYADTRKGDKVLSILNPTKPDCERLLKYRRNGEVYSDDSTVEKEIKEILNLNYERLVKNRVAAWKGIKRKLAKHDWKPAVIEKLISTLNEKNGQGEYNEYCMFSIYRLKKELNRRR